MSEVILLYLQKVLAEQILDDSLSKMELFIKDDPTIGPKQLKESLNSTFTILSNIMDQNQVLWDYNIMGQTQVFITIHEIFPNFSWL